MSKIIRSEIRHQVTFAPDPENTAFPTQPKFVESRQISEITSFPPGVKYVSFIDIVVTEVEFASGTRKTVQSPPFNEEFFHVTWSEADAEKLTKNNWPAPIGVHPTLTDQVFVTPTSPKQIAEQVAA